MLINNPPAACAYRHDYVRLAYVVGTLILFLAFIILNPPYDCGHYYVNVNGTAYAVHARMSEITPAQWAYKILNTINYIWQFVWLLYSLTFIFRRSSTGYLYLSPNTFTPVFYFVYVLSFLIPTVWFAFFEAQHTIWTWVIYLASFLLLSWALYIINNNISLNHKIYETEGLHRDIWYLRILAQNGVAFFACWIAVRFVLAFTIFLQAYCNVSVVNAGTVGLGLIAIIAVSFFFGPNFNAALVERCAYQFAPWIVFIIYLWGVIEYQWIRDHPTRNNIIAAVELAICLISAGAGLVGFVMRYRASKIDTCA